MSPQQPRSTEDTPSAQAANPGPRQERFGWLLAKAEQRVMKGGPSQEEAAWGSPALAAFPRWITWRRPSQRLPGPKQPQQHRW